MATMPSEMVIFLKLHRFESLHSEFGRGNDDVSYENCFLIRFDSVIMHS